MLISHHFLTALHALLKGGNVNMSSALHLIRNQEQPKYLTVFFESHKWQSALQAGRIQHVHLKHQPLVLISRLYHQNYKDAYKY